MTLDEASEVITQELIESHTRSHIPYSLASGPSALGDPSKVKEAVFVSVQSEVYGRIAEATAETIADCLIQIANQLLETREQRQASEQ